MEDANKKASLSSETGSETYSPGKSPEKDAWFTTFIIENHLDYFTYPDHASSPEQIRFMVHLDTDEIYYPCSDAIFNAIMSRSQSAFLQKKYNEVLQRILDLIERRIENDWEKSYLESLIITKYQHETRDEIMIPSRLEKRLMTIFIKRTQIEDPYLAEKMSRNRRAHQIARSQALSAALNQISSSEMENTPSNLSDMKKRMEQIEFRRLLSLLGSNRLWETDGDSKLDKSDYTQIFNQTIEDDGFQRLCSFLGLQENEDVTRKQKKILWLPNESGEIIFDLAIIQFIVGLGHKVILALKEGPMYTMPDVFDAQDDEILNDALKGALFITEKNVTKNDLVKMLRSDAKVFVISDGTSEKLNLLLVSTTFARAFKEVDGVVSRGPEQRRRLCDVHFQFTQDIYNIFISDEDRLSITHKPAHGGVVKFSHEDLELKANNIIDQMKDAKKNNMSVVFYSGIIGSIPGKIDVAKKIMSVTVDFLKQQAENTFIINPSEYYEPGMDADDLMYMWEIVQRSGYIDIWRFQTYADITHAFEIMDQKIPPEWVGKDATYSTGCTKEMRIALDVQQQNPEMQIIGPSKEKFMRRSEYGIGSMFDARLLPVQK